MPSAPVRERPSITRQAFSAMYRKSRLAASGARARNTMLPLEELLDGTEADTRFELEATISGGDESTSYVLWGWDATIGELSGRVRACFLVPITRIHEVCHA